MGMLNWTSPGNALDMHSAKEFAIAYEISIPVFDGMIASSWSHLWP